MPLQHPDLLSRHSIPEFYQSIHSACCQQLSIGGKDSAQEVVSRFIQTEHLLAGRKIPELRLLIRSDTHGKQFFGWRRKVCSQVLSNSFGGQYWFALGQHIPYFNAVVSAASDQALAVRRPGYGEDRGAVALDRCQFAPSHSVPEFYSSVVASCSKHVAITGDSTFLGRNAV